ncbi:MAG: hypothetical protein WCG85_28125 [Polyangia bacterium]
MRKKAESRRQVSGGESSTLAAREPSPAPPTPAAAAGESSRKIRCRGATRYGDPCRFWALPDGEFCYWCEQAGRTRFPLPAPAGEAAQAASAREIHKKRCQGVTVFGDQCRFWAVGSTDYCVWCSGSHSES